jgi:phytanoyl-CoA hydroxylase
MRDHATDQEISDYQRDGFVAVHGLLNAEETAELRAAVEMASGLDQAIADGSMFHQRVNLWRSNATVRRYLVESAIGRIVAQLSGIPKLRLWHDHSLCKGPWMAPTTWHLDTPYWSFHDRRPLSIWIALEDATLANGCLHFLPGSHRLARFDNVGLDHGRMGALFDVYPEMATIDPVAVPLKAGSATIHNGLTAHAAGGNMTRGWRKAMTCIYFPDEAVYSGQVNAGLSPEKSLTIQIGDRVADENFNPLVFPQSHE